MPRNDFINVDGTINYDNITSKPDLNAYQAEYVSVKQFGAIGNGTTDDTTAIQNAINSLTSGGSLFIPKGTYRITTLITISTDNIALIGAGKEVSVLFADSCDGITITGNNNTIANFSLKTNSTTHIGISIQHNFHTISNIMLKGTNTDNYYWAKNIYAVSCWYCVFEKIDCMGGSLHTTTNTYLRGKGIYMDYCINNKITNCQLLYLDYGIQITNLSEGIVIANNILLGINYGIYADSGGWYDIGHNILDMMCKYGVYFDLSNGTGNIISNWIAQHYYSPYGSDTTYIGILINQGHDISIRDNEFNTTCQPDVGIKINTSATKCVVSGNHPNWSKTGILCLGDSNVISENICYGCATNDINIGGSYNTILGNVLTDSKLYIDSSKAGNVSQRDSILLIVNATTAGQASLNVDVAIPSGYFAVKAAAGFMQSADNTYMIIANYMYTDSATTATNARFNIIAPSGNLPTATLRLSVMLYR